MDSADLEQWSWLILGFTSLGLCFFIYKSDENYFLICVYLNSYLSSSYGSAWHIAISQSILLLLL
jgi:hypothetical protein